MQMLAWKAQRALRKQLHDWGPVIDKRLCGISDHRRLSLACNCAVLCCAAGQVSFDPDVVGVRTLLRLIDRDLGYPARLEEEGGDADGMDDPAERDRRFWLRRFLWAALFSVPTFFLAMVGSRPTRALVRHFGIYWQILLIAVEHFRNQHLPDAVPDLQICVNLHRAVGCVGNDSWVNQTS